MSSKKYKILSSVGNLYKLNNILNKGTFLGCFQIVSLKFENSILIKKLILKSHLKIFVCKNVLIKKSKIFPNSFLTSMSQGCILVVYSFLNLSSSSIFNDLLSKVKLLPLIFRIDNKFTLFNKLSLLLDKSKNEIYGELLKSLNNHINTIYNFLVFSNIRLQFFINP